MKARNLCLIVCCVAVLAVAGIVWAQNPHFTKSSVSILSNGNLQVCFKEAGLGDDVTVSYTVTADAGAIYRCVNPGGQCIDGHQDVAGPVTGTGTFTSGRNGTISDCITITPPPVVNNTCPGGSSTVLSFVDYSNITITDTTNGVSAQLSPNTVSEILFRCRK